MHELPSITCIIIENLLNRLFYAGPVIEAKNCWGGGGGGWEEEGLKKL